MIVTFSDNIVTVTVCPTTSNSTGSTTACVDDNRPSDSAASYYWYPEPLCADKPLPEAVRCDWRAAEPPLRLPSPVVIGDELRRMRRSTGLARARA